MALQNNPDFRDDCGKGGGYGNRAYNEGVAARCTENARRQEQRDSATSFKPAGFSSKSIRRSGSGAGGASTPKLLAAVAAAWFVVWPWLGQVGFTRQLAGMVQGSSMDLRSAVLVAIRIQLFLLPGLCGFVAARLPLIGLLGSAALLYVHFAQ